MTRRICRSPISRFKNQSAAMRADGATSAPLSQSRWINFSISGNTEPRHLRQASHLATFIRSSSAGLTGAAMRFSGRKSPAFWFAAAALVYLTSGLFLTLTVHVPMNEALAATAITKDNETAREIWQGYSERWQFWNQARTITSGIALPFAGFGLVRW
nr:anthrone oxygenase family protein [Mesorhizobium sp.]